MATNTSNIPVVTVEPDKNEVPFKQVDDSEYKGSYKNLRDGLIYALAIQPGCSYEKPYKAKNSARFWEGTAEQFRQEFEKQ